MKKLFVYFEDKKVGIVNIDEEEVYSFQYESSWLNDKNAFPLSLSIPLNDQKFGNKLTKSFFENLLPEGELRQQIEKSRGIGGTYSFLRDFGKDCAGAFIVTTNEKKNADFNSQSEELPMSRIYGALDEKRPVAELISSIEPGYLSLAGAQDKFPVILKNDKFFLPTGGAPTTHIVKTPIWMQGVKESVYNEFFCMLLARRIGFKIPDFKILEGKFPLFVIERYDRNIAENGTVSRIHQQDFCQAQGITSESKYEKEGGPTIWDNYELIRNEVEVKKRFQSLNSFLDWISFNILIGNNDSHSKNISFLMKDGVELAPFYDLLCTEIYPGLRKRFSFSIGGRYETDKIGIAQFSELENNLEIKKKTFIEIFVRIMEKIDSSYKTTAEDVKKQYPDCKVTTRIVGLIKKRIIGFRKRLELK